VFDGCYVMKIRLRILTETERHIYRDRLGKPIVTVYAHGTGYSGSMAMLEQWDEHRGEYAPVEVVWE